ncbi:MAG: hypothetical protein RR350_09320 [Oscillibacter sp.]
MKKSMALLCAFVLLTLTLLGCGEDEKAAANRSVPNTGVTSDQMLDGGIKDGQNDAAGMKNDAADPRRDTAYGASYGQMLRNGRVHDTDGNLRDGENPHTPGSTF